MKYQSDRNILTGVVVWGAIGMIVFCVVNMVCTDINTWWLSGILEIVAGLLLWMWLSTYYNITGTQLYYRSGPVNGVIDIKQIHTIISHKSMYTGLKPALGSKGCIIKYNQFDEIYLSPKAQKDFIAQLLTINPAIKVVATPPQELQK
ncbi:PH domain-containing protein [Mucilaginibacter galii]|uniref:Uncharacterized protein YyaB-like PH domain-containing protein n=1 Tax=Mucilaginibacter galii TaxID=2005073 RepID=A0A917N314_9SPHI|nr:PH domain-containing protein [Mucilaginibacter galii]GGI52473.1 hypothetical protein GCM10011425_36850 [Mucilaginibacter galii]